MDSGSLSLSLAGTDKFSRSLTQDERVDMHADVQEANPGMSAKEHMSAHRAAMVKAGLAAWKKKSHDESDPALSPSLAGANNTGRAVSSANERDE